jgi:hypothetical protein
MAGYALAMKSSARFSFARIRTDQPPPQSEETHTSSTRSPTPSGRHDNAPHAVSPRISRGFLPNASEAAAISTTLYSGHIDTSNEAPLQQNSGSGSSLHAHTSVRQRSGITTKNDFYTDLCQPENLSTLKHYLQAENRANSCLNGKSLLMTACASRNVEAVKLLLEAGADVIPHNIHKRTRATALSIALEFQNKEIVARLVEKHLQEFRSPPSIQQLHLTLALQTGDTAIIRLIQLCNADIKLEVDNDTDIVALLPLIQAAQEDGVVLLRTELLNKKFFLHVAHANEASTHTATDVADAYSLVAQAFEKTLAEVVKKHPEALAEPSLKNTVRLIRAALTSALDASPQSPARAPSLELLLLYFSIHASHAISHHIGNVAGIAQTPITPNTGLVEFLSAIRDERRQLDTLTACGDKLEILEREAIEFWLRGRTNHQATVDFLRQLQSVTLNRPTLTKINHLITQLASPTSTSLALLHDNFYGRAFDTFLAIQLYQHASPALLASCEAYVDFIKQIIDGIPNEQVHTIAERILHHVGDGNRPWYPMVIRKTLRRPIDFSGMTHVQARNFMKSMVDQPGKTKIFSAFLFSAELVRACYDNKYHPPWIKGMFKNYPIIHKMRNRKDLQSCSSAAQYRSNLTTGGITMQHQPALICFDAAGSPRPVLMGGPDLSNASSTNRRALSEGKPLAVDLSGTMNIVGHFMGMMREQGLIDMDDINNLTIATAACMVIDGGHSFQETLWTYNQIANTYPSFNFPKDSNDIENFVVNYQTLLERSTKATTRPMDDVVRATFADLLGHHAAVRAGIQPPAYVFAANAPDAFSKMTASSQVEMASGHKLILIKLKEKSANAKT